MLCQSFRVDEDSPVCPGSLFLSAAEEAPHETVERHIRGISGVLRATAGSPKFQGGIKSRVPLVAKKVMKILVLGKSD